MRFGQWRQLSALESSVEVLTHLAEGVMERMSTLETAVNDLTTAVQETAGRVLAQLDSVPTDDANVARAVDEIRADIETLHGIAADTASNNGGVVTNPPQPASPTEQTGGGSTSNGGDNTTEGGNTAPSTEAS